MTDVLKFHTEYSCLAVASKFRFSHRKNERKDTVDEQLENIKYVFWKGNELKKEGQLHISHQRFMDAPIVITQQLLDTHCILCPRKKELVGKVYDEAHYQHVHHGHSLVVKDIIMLMCKCSEVHSAGSDGATLNSHWHCL